MFLFNTSRYSNLKQIKVNHLQFRLIEYLFISPDSINPTNSIPSFSTLNSQPTDYAIEDCLRSVGITAIILAMLCIICGDKNEKSSCKRWYNKVVFDNSQWLILWLCWTLSTTSFALKGTIWMSSLSVETSKYSFSFGQ